MPPEDAGPAARLRGSLASIPRPLRAAGLGLFAGVAGGATATIVDPDGTLLTLVLILAVVAAVTVLATRIA